MNRAALLLTSLLLSACAAYPQTIAVKANPDGTLAAPSNFHLAAGGGVTSLAGTSGEVAVSGSTGAITVSLPSSLVFTGKGITGGTFDAANIGTTTAGTGRFTSIVSTTGSIISTASSPAVQALGTLNSGLADFIATNNLNANLLTGVYGSTAASTLFGVNKAGAAFVQTTASGGTYPTAFLIGTGDTAPVVFGVNGSEAGRITTTGYQGAIGQTTPANGVFTTLSLSSNANIRLSKANLHLQVNVMDYGATGDGTTDDRAAIESAFFSVPSHGTVYFPPGKYRLASVLSDISSKSYLTVTGTGAEIYNDTGSAGGNTFTFDSTCNNIEVCGLRFTGTSSVRGNGVHVRMAASNSTIHNNQFSGCSDFAVLVSQGTGTGWVSNVSVTNNIFGASLGDGVHVGSAILVTVANNLFESTGDDSIGIVADYASYAPNRVLVIGNNIYDAGGSGSSGCGIRIAEGTDITVVGNSIYQSYEAAIFIGRNNSTTAFNERLLIADNKIAYSTHGGAGMLAGITVQFANECTIRANTIEATVNGGGISPLDCNHLVIQENYIKTCPGRGIGSDDGTTTNVAASCTQWIITGNVVDNCGTSGLIGTESYYVAAHSGKTIADLLLTENKALVTPAGDYIFTNRLLNLAKVGNNTVLEAARTVTNGGTGLAPATFNNQ